MDKPTEIEEREAPHGEKMIELRVRFWTNLASEKGHVIPKHAYAAGIVRVAKNETHGLGLECHARAPQCAAVIPRHVQRHFAGQRSAASSSLRWLSCFAGIFNAPRCGWKALK